MRRRRVLWVGLAVLAAWLWVQSRPIVYRYKMTVEVATPEGLKTGSAVREIVYHKAILKLPDAPPATARLRGEAVAVDLSGGPLFALLPIRPYETLQAAFGDDAPETLRAAKADGRVAELKPRPGRSPEYSGLPMLVRFRDPGDPTSVEEVTPATMADQFGSGVTLKRITLQLVDDPVTTGIKTRLPWLADRRRVTLDPIYGGLVLHPTFAQRLGRIQFLQGEDK